MSAGERLLRALREKGVKQVEAAKSYGSPPQYVNDVIHGRRELRGEFAAWLAETYEINLTWLFTGKGPMFLAARLARAAAESPVQYNTLENEGLLRELGARLGEIHMRRIQHVTLAEDEENFERLEGAQRYYAVPFMEGEASAGAGRVVPDEIAGYVVIHRDAVSSPANLLALRITGDSMTPTLPPRSIVVMDCSLRDPQEIMGKIACCRTESHDVVIKRVAINGHTLLLRSDNRAYEPIPVDLRVVPQPIIGQAVWACQNLRQEEQPHGDK